MVDVEKRLSIDYTTEQVNSLATPFPEFQALSSIPDQLGFAAHSRLEGIFSTPIASDASQPEISNPEVHQRSGVDFSTRIGKDRDFMKKNLPIINDSIKEVAANNEISVAEVWDELFPIVLGSGIGMPMHRTLDHPLGGLHGAQEYIDENASNGITIILRENIANWGERRQNQLTALLGGLSIKALSNVRQVIYGGSGRVYSGDELWRPQFKPYTFETENNEGKTKKTSIITEHLAASLFHAPRTRRALTGLGINDNVEVDVVGLHDTVSGDDVMRAIAAKHGHKFKDSLVIEIGNAPAGYTQLAGALVLAKELRIDPSRQYVAITDGVEIVKPAYFSNLTIEEKSRVQNGATALNSINGWLKAIIDTKKYILGIDQ